MRYGMAGLVEDVKEGFAPKNLASAGKVAGGALGGAIVAKIVVAQLADLRKGKDERADKTVADVREKLLPEWAPGVAPLLVGVAVAGATSKKFPNVGAGVAAGMFVVGLGSILKGALRKSAEEDKAASKKSLTVTIYDNLAGFGAVDTYDSPLLAGLGAFQNEYDFGVGRYMNGAVVVPQVLRGAPIDIQNLQMNGLGASPTTASIVTSSGNMSAALM